MPNTRSLKFAAFALTVCFGSTAASAHPHVWIENRSDVVFNDEGKIIAISVEWAFDKDYSAIAIEGLDANNDGYYSAGELQPLAAENIKALKDYDYFVYAKLGKQKVTYGEVTDFGQHHTSDILKMYFTVPLTKPIDPKAGQFSYMIYDPSFFIAIDYPDASFVSAIGNTPAGCSVEMRKPPSDEETSETRQMLSEKPADWQPDTEQDFGSLFAQPVAVICKRKTAKK